MRRALGVVAVALAPIGACRATPAPRGEALVVVQTDVAVPRRVNRMRIEVLDAKGALVERRDVDTPSQDDWPVSFSVVLPDGSPESDVFVRLRAFPEGHELSAREIQRFALEPPRNATVYRSIDDACKNAPPLRLAEPLTLRRGSTPITSLLHAQGCDEQTASGSAVARLEIKDQGDYRIAITHSVPNGAASEPGSDTALSLRTECPFPTTQFACVENIGPDNHLSQIERVTLAPGVYFVVTGGEDPAPADLTLLASRLDVFQPAPASTAPPLTADPGALDPEPGVTIDEIVGMHVRPGERGTVDVILRGECFGTPSDFDARVTCIDTAGQRAPVPVVVPGGALTLDLPKPPPWPGDTPVPCTVAPRGGEVCIPGDAFVLGDTLALEDLERRSQPERVRVVDPFLLDVHEMSVGRFRDALAHGFRSPDATPLANPETVLTRDKPRGMCTWSDAPLGRESMPLTCISSNAARALCNFLGGDLATEDQWELAATAAGKDDETPYPWGRDLPTCDRTVFGRTTLPTSACPASPLGPVPVDDPALVRGDVTPLGVVGLGGNVEELLATPFIPYADPVWTRAGLRGPVDEAEAPLRSARGADWTVGSLYATASTRRSEPVTAAYDNVGFRCARRGR